MKHPAPRRDRRRRLPLTDRDVRRQAHRWLRLILLAALAHPFAVGARRDLADLVLRSAAQRSSVTRARAHSRRGTSDRHALRLLEHLDLGRTQRAETRALHEQARLYVPRHPVDIALDFDVVPYYGQPIDPKDP